MVETLGHLKGTFSLSSRSVIRLLAVALAYFVLAKAGLQLASINPSATPVWPPTGFAIAAVLLWGYDAWPGIALGALLANATTSGTLATSAAIAVGNTLEAVIGAGLIWRWAGGVGAFERPGTVAAFAIIVSAIATPVSASIGVATLTAAGLAQPEAWPSIWVTWWLGDLTGALLVTPVVVLWVRSQTVWFPNPTASAIAVATAIAVGLIAFSPLLPQTGIRNALAFFAVAPLLWAALMCGPRDTASIAIILSGFAVWGVLFNGGPFAHNEVNESFLTLLGFMIGTSLPSLVLGADVAMRTAAQDDLRSVLDAASVGVFDINNAEGTFNRSNGLNELYGYPREHRITLTDVRARYHPDDSVSYVEQTTFGAADPTVKHFKNELRLLMPGLAVRWLYSQGEFIRDASGKAIRTRGVVIDVTDRKRMEQTQALLLAELDHRIKNTLAIAQAIVRQTLHSAHTMTDAERDVSARLRALASAHDLLRDRQWLEAPLGEIVHAAIAANSIEPSRVRIVGPLLVLSSAQALSMTIALHELTTNAMKHGALSTDHGSVQIEWRLEGIGPPRMFVFEWREEGGPAVAIPTRRGFGSRLIERTFDADFKAKISVDYRVEGLVFIARAPWTQSSRK